MAAWLNPWRGKGQAIVVKESKVLVLPCSAPRKAAAGGRKSEVPIAYSAYTLSLFARRWDLAREHVLLARDTEVARVHALRQGWMCA